MGLHLPKSINLPTRFDKVGTLLTPSLKYCHFVEARKLLPYGSPFHLRFVRPHPPSLSQKLLVSVVGALLVMFPGFYYLWF